MSLFPLDWAIRRVVSYGRLTVIDTDGAVATFGVDDDGPRVTMRIHDEAFKRKAAFHPTMAIGEGYVDGAFTLESGTLRDFLDILLVSVEQRSRTARHALIKSARALYRLPAAINRIGRAEQNVQHHYDIDHRLYELFLDSDMQYSCAYWRDGTQSLEQAQLEKKRHLAKKLLLEPGMRVLDIGSGWGGLALHLAREHGVHVTGVTLSQDQYRTSVRRAAEAGLSDQVAFKLLDYRREPGTYDRIVSVGMFEHVGQPHYGEFFNHIMRLLKERGVAVLHTIGKMSQPAPINAWIRRYIFPGAYLPTLSQLAPLLEKRRFWLTDFESWRLHYSRTLREWDRRFQDKRAEIAGMFDERFCRMWEFYLQSCERSFMHQRMTVFQLQLAKAVDIVPITRDYLYAEPAPVPAVQESRTSPPRLASSG